jgi:hypothetical protein
MDFTKLPQTPTLDESISFADADDEMKDIAGRVIADENHHQHIFLDKIKFLYTTKPKKEGGKFVIGSVIARSEMEMAVDNKYEHIICIYQPCWKDLDGKNKCIQMDKLLCAIAPLEDTNSNPKKQPIDVREYSQTLTYWGVDPVLNSSEVVHLAIQSEQERKKQEKRDKKEKNGPAKKGKKNRGSSSED